MERTNRFIRGRSIRTRLVGLITVMLAVALTVNLFIYVQINTMVRKIDSVFATNVTITELTQNLSVIQEKVYEYLTTKSSEALEDYYRFEEEYRALLGSLNDKVSGNSLLMLEKNIRSMSESYLELADRTVHAKRGRNVERYKELFAEQTDLYGYINSYIDELNSMQFRQNSEKYERLLSTMRVMEILCVCIICGVFVSSIFALSMQIRRMLGPLAALAGAATEVAEGNFEAEVPSAEAEDEIGIVTVTFSKMLESIRAYIARLRTSMETEAAMKQRELEMEAHLKEAQLRFLQAQINPHFLFNSLNAGAQLAMMEDAEDTGVFLQRMADFFRYTVKNTNGYATLAEEIESVDDYIYILNVRFAGDITYEKSVPGDLPSVEMPGLILQPLVENAVSHGIRDMLDRGRIRLLVEVEEEGVRVVIGDNGRGMTREQIEQVFRAAAPQQAAGGDASDGMAADGALPGDGSAKQPGEAGSMGETVPADGADGSGRSSGTSIGLENVISRLRLYYGREDLLQIYSPGRNMGTEVTVWLPGEGAPVLTAEETAADGGETDVSDTDRGR